MVSKSLWVGCAAVGSSVAIPACGSSGRSHSSASGKYVSFLKFADCMRSHGVPAFPDPGAGGSGVHIGPGTGINPASPAFQSAMATCKKLLPGGGPKAAQLTESQKLRALRFAQCMRAHGVANFPDPSSGGPPGQVLSDVNSPAARQAIKKVAEIEMVPFEYLRRRRA